MKNPLFNYLALTLLSLGCFSKNSFPQDVITKKTGEDIQAKISEVTTNEVKYKKIDYLDGPTYSILKTEVLLIRYEDGTKDIFNEIEKVAPANPMLLTKEGNNVFVETLDATSEKGEEYLIITLDAWGYWNVVDSRNEADFILVFNMDDQGWNGNTAYVSFRTKDNQEFKKSGTYRAIATAFNGYNKNRAVADKVVNSYLKQEFE